MTPDELLLQLNWEELLAELNQLPVNSVPAAPLQPLDDESREAFLERAAAHYQARQQLLDALKS